MDIQTYLDRIKFESEIDVSKDVLFALHRQHLLNIPFENLDIHYGRKIELEIESIFHKIIVEKRGGFCYELNSLFNELLRAIGFNTFLISAQVYSNEVYGKEFDHIAIIVNLNSETYLVDVGFGKFIFEPIQMILEVPQKDQFGTFMIESFEENQFRVNQLIAGIREPQYIFTLNQRQLNQFNEMCAYHQTSIDSHFTRGKLISLSKVNGRITLTDTTLKVTNGDKTVTTEFENTEFEKYLNTFFDIQIATTIN